jgi:putative transposase
MPRLARVVAVGLPHHITQRGNYQQDVFRSDGDRITYLGLIAEYCKQAQFRLIGYCLMTNHVHLIVVPEREDSLARGLGLAHCRYAHCVNARRRSTGHLWQNRYYSTAMDEAHLRCAMRYVERNPVRAGMVRNAVEYVWSSARAHLTGLDATGMLDLPYWAARASREEWRDELGVTEAAGELAAIRAKTATGRPLGSKDFVAALERKMGRVLEPRATGRPRKRLEGEAPSAIQTALSFALGQENGNSKPGTGFRDNRLAPSRRQSSGSLPDLEATAEEAGDGPGVDTGEIAADAIQSHRGNTQARRPVLG